MPEYVVSTIDALGDSSDSYIEADNDGAAIEEGKWAFDNEMDWQRASADRTTRVLVAVFSIDEDGVTDDLWDKQLDVHPKARKCRGACHRFDRTVDGDTITDICRHCDIVRTVKPDEYGDIKVAYR